MLQEWRAHEELSANEIEVNIDFVRIREIMENSTWAAVNYKLDEYKEKSDNSAEKNIVFVASHVYSPRLWQHHLACHKLLLIASVRVGYNIPSLCEDVVRF